MARTEEQLNTRDNKLIHLLTEIRNELQKLNLKHSETPTRKK
jgi:hypothetical protein